MLVIRLHQGVEMLAISDLATGKPFDSSSAAGQERRISFWGTHVNMESLVLMV
jgi:hypothetical protein